MTFTSDIKKHLESIITFIILIPFSFSYLISPLNDDTRIYQGVASLTDYFGSFPANINNAWEIKPIANRGINYILYKISTLFRKSVV